MSGLWGWKSAEDEVSSNTGYFFKGLLFSCPGSRSLIRFEQSLYDTLILLTEVVRP